MGGRNGRGKGERVGRGRDVIMATINYHRLGM